MILWEVVGVLVIAANVAQATGLHQLSTQVCTSDVCHQVAREIVSSMDATVNPCMDFYAYACNRLNSSNGVWSEVLRLKISKQLKDVRQRKLHQSHGRKSSGHIQPVHQPDEWYSESLNGPFDVQTIRRLVRVVDDLFGGWSLLKGNPNVSAFRLDDVVSRLQQNNIQSILYLSVEKNDFSTDQNILFLRLPGRLYDRWGLCARYPGPCNAARQLTTVWKSIVKGLMKVTNASAQWFTVEKRLEKVLILDFMLSTVPKGTVDLLKRLTFGDLSKPPFRSHFLSSLLSLFNVILKETSVKFRATVATQFGDPFPEYLLKLDQTMAQLESDGDAGLATLADWLWWTTLYHYYIIYQEAHHCVQLLRTAMPLTVSRMFFETYIPSGVVQKAHKLISEIADGVRDAVILKTIWMDRATQETAMDRLNHTLLNVGYPREFLDNWTLIDDLYAKVS
ncbi:neprilysin-2-like [Paramacrobiotus metropolitanus]|uniref:neprilysin-2-like n=1 Tax=Paramacrobiotus metropolitanus TaxID=2943436 RepID=UPI0024461C11|nr:neprilysin-2-like [Paramacrobiotus metropolitanus]